MTRYKQRLPDPYVKGLRDMGIVRFGHLNALADRVTAVEQGTSVLTGPLIFEGTTANAYELTVSPGDPTADRTITFPDLTGTVVVTAGAQTIAGIKTFSSGVVTPVGTVGTPSIQIGYVDTGFYAISATQTGFSQDGTLVFGFNSAGIFTNTIAEQLTGSGITIAQNTIEKKSLTALDATGTITAAMVNKGGITSTSAAAVLATLDTATAIGTQIGAVNGTSIEFVVDNTAGANTVTVAVGAGITVCSGVVTGSDTLTVSVANAIGIFRLVFSSATVAKLYRIG